MAVKSGKTWTAKSMLGAAGTRVKAIHAAKAAVAKKPGVKTVQKGSGNVNTPKPIKHSRMTYIKAQLDCLRYDHDKFKKAIEALHSKKPIPVALQKLIEAYCYEILKCADAYPNEIDGKVRNKGKLLVMKLRAEMMDFDEKYSKYRISYKGKTRMTVSQLVHKVICELNGGVAWFVNQHDMIHSSVSSLNSLPHRPKNWALRQFFEVETKKHQQTKNSTKTIRYKIFDKMLNNHNKANPNQTPLKVSARSYGKLVNEWKNGDLFNLA